MLVAGCLSRLAVTPKPARWEFNRQVCRIPACDWNRSCRPDLRALIVKRRRAEGNRRIRAMTSQPATLFGVAWTSWAGANRPRVTPSVALHPIGTRISGRAAWHDHCVPSHYAAPFADIGAFIPAKFFAIGASGGKRRPWVKNKKRARSPHFNRRHEGG